MSITFVENQTRHVDFNLKPMPLEDYHYIHLPAEGNEIVWDGPTMDVAEAVSTLENFYGVYFWNGEEWIYYIPGYSSNRLTQLVYGKTYLVTIGTYPQDWKVPNYTPPPPMEGVYTCAIYYCYLEGCEGSTNAREWNSNWSEWCRHLAEYEINLIVDYIRAQGLDADMPILSIEKVAVAPEYLDGLNLKWTDFLSHVLENMSNFSSTDIHICIGEANYQMGAASVGYGTVMIRGGTLEQEIGAMNGEPFYTKYPMVYCELAHELGHNFHLGHCGAQNKPCPMAQMQITYDEWVSMGKRLWFCNISRPILLANWEKRVLI